MDSNVYKFKFKRSMTVQNMKSVVIKDKDKTYVVDPNLLFQRLLSSLVITNFVLFHPHIFV